MSIVWSLSIVRPNGYFSLELHRQRINCVREDTHTCPIQKSVHLHFNTPVDTHSSSVHIPPLLQGTSSSTDVAKLELHTSGPSQYVLLLLWTKTAMRLAEDNRREIVPRRRHTPIQNRPNQPCFWTLARRGQGRRDYGEPLVMLVITAPPWIPVSGVAGPDIVDPITYRLSPEHSLNTELALTGGTRQFK
ncbi:hypothetical protein FGSG_05526 [Fusarium graminearum PH-1]|uniref:Chromosome 3, complete genome n=1 Tax=Gibberella zeae (strain ATCC MYA-4620 / CBS 123657 / FGSC 9075 / NRRL 31084 / PH-1) TaxID=229533 RepID=I1RNF0_GIBZE|nr:hypothetical protein FGSG_05526 [Fusarium graminearum PH-1]ESU11497.1 hypothetical protein FGSG_05526 [Fusarium graminearum PH-1]CEF87063.1 unnamed protein product [Fusarium graminearum]|eukprot:XP_011324073.1 hypothetical protein FGSG_05526 [Fusarium graminearum PH-1]